MKLALLGFGAMGKMVAECARLRGDEIVLTVGRTNRPDDWAKQLLRADVAIDFSAASAVAHNVTACLSAKLPIVIGTTGWAAELPDIRKRIESADGAMLHGANFSVGVNLFYRIASQAAAAFRSAGGYEAFIEEQHHSRKKDAPSGTALKLQSILTEQGCPANIASTRAGHITGTHRIGFDSAVDQIVLTHTARSRQGFAQGAILAAQWLIGRRGVYEFDDVMESILEKSETEHGTQR